MAEKCFAHPFTNLSYLDKNVARGIALLFLMMFFIGLLNENGDQMVVALIVVLSISFCFRTFFPK